MKWEKVKLGDIATCIQPGRLVRNYITRTIQKRAHRLLCPKI